MISPENMIKTALNEKKLVMGRNDVVRMLKMGSIESVFIADNCPPNLLQELEYYTKVSAVGLHKFKENSIMLGQLCGKPFNITVLGIKK